MGNAQSNEQIINVAYVKVTYTSGDTRTFRIPLEDEENVNSPYATYSRVIESVAEAFRDGKDGFVQLAELDKNNETVIVFIALWNVNSIEVNVAEEVM